MSSEYSDRKPKPRSTPRPRRGASREHKTLLVAPSEAADKRIAWESEGWECWHQTTRDGKTELHFRRLKGT